MRPIRPRVDADEREALQGWLNFQRAILLGKAEGLSDEQSRFRHAPSDLTVLGLLRHLAEGERWWFRLTFAGEEIKPRWSASNEPEPDFYLTSDDTLAEAIAAHREECDAANNLIARSELDQVAAYSPAELRGLRPSLRWIITHMIEETARHNGHADLIREAIDGRVGDQ